jgi:hypothetical protein
VEARSDLSADQPEKRISLLATLRASVLCRRELPVNSTRDTIGWWEARRIPFNLIVGSAGILTCVVVGIVGLASEVLFHSEFGLPNPPLFVLFGVIIYGILANACYTGGWVTELIVRRMWPREADRFATLSFSLGIIFSVLVTLVPAVLVGALGIFKLLNHLRRIHA